MRVTVGTVQQKRMKTTTSLLNIPEEDLGEMEFVNEYQKW